MKLLVNFSESININLSKCTQTTIKLLNAVEVEENYEIFAKFLFSSETK